MYISVYLSIYLSIYLYRIYLSIFGYFLIYVIFSLKEQQIFETYEDFSFSKRMPDYT